MVYLKSHVWSKCQRIFSFCNYTGRGQHSRNGGMKEAVQEKEKAERNGYRYRGTSQEEQSTDDSMNSPDGTGPIAQTPSYNVATGQDTSTMKTSEMTVVRRNKTLSLLSNDRPRSMSASPSSLFPPSTIISRANTNESSETLLNEQGNHNN